MYRATIWRLTAILVATAFVAAACGGGSGDSSASDGSGSDDSSAQTDDSSAEPTKSGVGTEEIDETDSSAGDPVMGGTLRFALNGEDDGLNPTTSRLSAPGLSITSAVYDPLVAYSKDGDVVPYLAEEFFPNDDYTVWTFKLRDGIKFHDGTPLNSDAALKTLEAQRRDLIIGLAIKPLVSLSNPFVKVDDLTFEIHLSEPWAYFPAFLAGRQFGYISSPTWLDAAEEDPTLNQEPVGTGPFKFESRDKDSLTRLVRNDDYWNGPVYLDALEFEIYTDGDIRATALEEGTIDGMHSNEPSAIASMLDNDDIDNALDDTGEEQLDLINTQAPPFDDIRARMALTYATPQNNYVTLLGGGVVRRADQMFDPDSPYHNPDVVQETDQPEKALELVATYCADVPASCTNGKINFTRKTSGPSVGQTREAELLAQGWSQAGFNVDLETIPLDDHIQDVIFGRYQVADWRQFGAVDPSEDNVWLLCKTATTALALNFPRLCDPDRDALLLEAQNELDPTRRAQLYQQLSAMVQKDYAYLFYVHTLWDIAVRSNVHGVCNRTNPEGDQLRCQINGVAFFDKAWIEG